MNAEHDPIDYFLLQRIARAEAAFEADREQAMLAKEARADARAEQGWVAESKARGLRRRWGR